MFRESVKYVWTSHYYKKVLVLNEFSSGILLTIPPSPNIQILLYVSGQNEKGRQQNNKSEKAFVKEYVWPQHKDYGEDQLYNITSESTI